MKVIVIGAGIGGLCAGLALRRIGYSVEIFEQVTEIRPAGAAISIWSNGVKCLNYLGLAAKVSAIGGKMDSMAYVDGLSGDTLTAFSLQPLYDRVGQRPYPVSRAELQSMLIDEFGRDLIHFGMKLTGIEDDGQQVTAIFADGTTAKGDLLIGADGAHSFARSYILGEQKPRRYAGYVNWNGLIETDGNLSPADRWTTFVGEGKRVSLMPVSNGRSYFFFDVPLPAGLPNERGHYHALLQGYFEGWAPPVQALIARLNPATTNRVEIHDLDPFDSWTKGRVALLGDAAHNTAPDLGQGGCMAMEDAVVLAHCLQSHSNGIEDALVRYQTRRAPRTTDLVLRARKRSDVTHAIDAEANTRWYDELGRETGAMIMQGIASNIEGGPFA